MPVSFRLVTLHPALAHLAIGTTFVVLVAAVVAGWRRDERWSFAADVALLVAAPSLLVTAIFGLVSNWVVRWPGGLEFWRWVHLALGLGATTAIWVLGLVRWQRRLRPSGRAHAAVLVGLAVLVAATGWVGGEVLVFHSGMAVAAGGEGAMAPPLRHTRPRGDFLAAMHDARAAWGGMHSELAWMLVQEPRDAGFARIAQHADKLAAAARRMAAKAELAAVANGARTLETDAAHIADAARRRDLAALPPALGRIGSDCANCHKDNRW